MVDRAPHVEALSMTEPTPVTEDGEVIGLPPEPPAAEEAPPPPEPPAILEPPPIGDGGVDPADL